LKASTEFAVLDADDGLELWLDKSGNDNNAEPADPTRRPRPVYSTDDALSAVAFGDQGATLIVRDSDSLRFGVDDFSCLIVARWRNSVMPAINYVGYAAIIAKAEDSFPYRGISLFANYPTSSYFPAWPRFAFQLGLAETLVLSRDNNVNDNVMRLYVARRSGNVVEIRINGELEATSEIYSAPSSLPLNVSAIGQNLMIGGYDGGALDGDIAEIVLIRGSIDQQDLQQLESGLMQEHSLVHRM
jgi:hypothetical protein